MCLAESPWIHLCMVSVVLSLHTLHTFTHTPSIPSPSPPPHPKRTSFYYNPALQSRSFLMLGVISQRASMSTITRTLKVLEETLGKHEDEIMMLEAIVICLTRMVPLLNEVCVWGGGYVWGVYVWVWGVWV